MTGPSEAEIRASLLVAVLHGLAEEVSPGEFRITDAGRAKVERMLAERPEAREFLAQVRRTVPTSDNRTSFAPAELAAFVPTPEQARVMKRLAGGPVWLRSLGPWKVIVGQLVKAGIAERVKPPTGRRPNMAVLTEAGRAALASALKGDDL